MYATTIDEISNEFLHDAAFVLSLKKNSPFVLRSLYMDPQGECAISYYGILSESQIKEIIQNYSFEDLCLDEIHPQEHQDYVFCNRHNLDKEPAYTTIFTPDGIDYKDWKHYCGWMGC